jgi:hypothetical protein
VNGMDETRIVRDRITLQEISALAGARFGVFVKAVVDVRRGVMAVGGQLHADQEGLLLDDGSRQDDLWGVNLHPAQPPDSWIEYDSMINLRPLQNNMTRSVEDPHTREHIVLVVGRLVVR